MYNKVIGNNPKEFKHITKKEKEMVVAEHQAARKVSKTEQLASASLINQINRDSVDMPFVMVSFMLETSPEINL